MKKIVLIVIAAVLACLLCGCGNNNENKLSAAEKTAMLMSETKFPSMVEVKAEKLEMYFDIAESDLTEYSAFICGSGAMPDEIGVFVAKDAGTAAKIKASIEKRMESQRKTYTDYTPKEMYKFDDSFVNVNGNTVSYSICADNTKAKEIFG